MVTVPLGPVQLTIASCDNAAGDVRSIASDQRPRMSAAD